MKEKQKWNGNEKRIEKKKQKRREEKIKATV